MSSFSTLWQSILGAMQHISFSDVLDIGLCWFFMYQLLKWTKRTAAYGILKGILALIGIRFVTYILQLNALGWVIDSFLSTGSIIIIIVILFQPEVRRMLENIGTTAQRLNGTLTADESERLVDDLTRSILSMSNRRTGVLIVFERKGSLGDIIATGTRIDGFISGALLENIFEKNTPLHDGAVIVRGTKIIAAATYLPLSDDRTIAKNLGTRHRAGIGITARTDCVSLIVSEETGSISIAQNGQLRTHIDEPALRNFLTSMFVQENEKSDSLFAFLKRRVAK